MHERDPPLTRGNLAYFQALHTTSDLTELDLTKNEAVGLA